MPQSKSGNLSNRKKQPEIVKEDGKEGSQPSKLTTSQLATLKKYQWRVFLALYFGYAFCYFGRLSFSSLTNFVVASGVSVSETGMISSSLATGYSLGRLFLVVKSIDDYSPAKLFPTVVIAVGVINLIFSQMSYAPLLILLWTCNGVLAGISWMPCASLVTRWYRKEERGLWWGILSTTSTLTSGFIQVGFPFICLSFFDSDWRSAILAISFFPLFGGVVAYFFIEDSPENFGIYINEQPNEKQKQENLPGKTRIIRVLTHYGVLLLSLSGFFIYIARAGITNWLALYLTQVKLLPAVTAGSVVFFVEIGGILGASSGGWISDRFFGSKRAPPNILSSFLAAFTLSFLPFFDDKYILYCIAFVFGFSMYIPQTFMGMHVVEIVDKPLVGTAMGYSGLYCGLGAIVAGYPLSFIVSTFGWDSFFISCVLSCFGCGLVLLPLYNK